MPRIKNGDLSLAHALREARSIGRKHGECAYLSDWRNLTDPLPEPDLSGQWADGYSSRDLIIDLFGRHADDDAVADLFTEVCDAYEDAYRAEVDRRADLDGLIRCDECRRPYSLHRVCPDCLEDMLSGSDESQVALDARAEPRDAMILIAGREGLAYLG